MGDWCRKTPDARVGEICDHLRGGGKDGRAVFPTHRKKAWKRHEWVFSWRHRKCNTKLRDIINVEGNAIKTITDVEFDQVDRAKGRVG